MKEIVELLLSPVWWISAVVVGIVINLVSAYLKGPLDVLLSGASGWWRTRTAKQIEERTKLIARLRGNTSAQIYHAYRASPMQITAVIMLLLLFAMTAFILPRSHFPWPHDLPSPVSTTLGHPDTLLTPYLRIANYFMLAILYFMTMRLFMRGTELGLALKEACDPDRTNESPSA